MLCSTVTRVITFGTVEVGKLVGRKDQKDHKMRDEERFAVGKRVEKWFRF